LRLFRVARLAFFNETDAFAGEGAYLAGSRWCTPGHHVSFASLSEALATLEYLTHLGDRRLAHDAVLVVADIDDALVERLDRRRLPRDWDVVPPGIATQRLGDAWLAAMTAPALRVPSVLSSTEENVCINRRHPDAAKIRVLSVEPWKLDARLRS
jgi:RES domain-containing protein